MTDTAKCSYLLHYTPPPEFGEKPVLLLASNGRKVERISLEYLSQIDHRLVTHSFGLLVDWFRNRSLPLPAKVVDLEVAKKLLVGRPKSDFGLERPWDMPSLLLKYIPSRYDQKQIRATLLTHLGKPAISDFSNLRWMTAIAAKLPELWKETCTELNEKGEILRFDDVEVPAYNSMLQAQYRGITIDQLQRDKFLESNEDDFLAAHHQLTIREKIDVDRALKDTEYLSNCLPYPLQPSEKLADLAQVLKVRKDSDRICGLLHKVSSARRNKSILLRTIGGNGGCSYPLYDTMGTVTGRILTIDPQLQRLSKKYRGVIKARTGYKAVYVDFSQFEPNIMSSISKDPQLVALCNQGDLYEQLAIRICGTTEHRKVTKLMFLAYSYGKQVSGLSEFLVGIIGSKEEADSIIQTHFLPLFAGIETWKSKIAKNLLQTGKIGTLLGNYRYRTRAGDLETKEQRWAVSQVVQGTGSLILKKLIIMLTRTLPEAFVLLPMHDALLMEIPEDRSTEVINELLSCCRKTFSEVCPLVLPVVCEKAFTEQ